MSGLPYLQYQNYSITCLFKYAIQFSDTVKQQQQQKQQLNRNKTKLAAVSSLGTVLIPPCMAAFVPPAIVPGVPRRHSASDFYRLLSVQNLEQLLAHWQNIS